MSYELSEGFAEVARSLALPIAWTADGPMIVAHPLRGAGERRMPYQPQEEYRYFLAHFPYRQGLDDLVEEEIHDWGSLAHLLNTIDVQARDE